MNLINIVFWLPSFFRRHKLIKLLLWLFPGSNTQLVHFNDSAKAWANISDPNPRNYFLKRQFDPFFFHIALPFLEKGGFFFDVGANFGFCSFGVIGILGDLGIDYHLFEANPEVYRTLLKSTELHKRQKITVNNYCISNQGGTSKIKIVAQQLGMSYIDSEGDYEVQNILLDEYIQSHHIQKVNFMKIDVEGWEPFAVQGCMQSFKTGKINALYIEISSKNLKRSQIRPQDFIEYLRSMELEVFYCKPDDILLAAGTPVTLRVNSQDIRVAPVKSFPSNHQTDLLAIHKNSGFLAPFNLRIENA